ncbi:MAG: FliA/WhiG family RNA polymerase sigma factor [Planctomycetes bacterium]|nr:FliA/WhiG family RNA polymerase sigma factor [Planctomycetota bacterium]
MTRADAYMALSTPEQKQKRFEDSLLLVKYVVGRLAVELPASLDRDDLYSWGAIGLWRAIQTYDASRGVAFSTHAYILIRGAILDELRRLDFLPRSRRDKLKAVVATRDGLVQKLGRKPSIEELESATGLKGSDLDEVLLSEHTAQVVSLDDSGSDDAGIGAILRSNREVDPSSVAETNELREQLAVAIGRLPKIEKEIVILYYNKNLLLKEIGEIMGFSESRASQIHARALERLRSFMLPAETAQAAEA